MSGAARTPLVAVALAGVIATPGLVHAQQASSWVPRVEIRGGIVTHGAGGCHREGGSGFTAGVEVRTRGTWFASAAADFMDIAKMGSDLCTLALEMRQYEGQQVGVWGAPALDRTVPRLSVEAGRRLGLPGGELDVAAGVGALRTKTTYVDPDPVVDWRPWVGATVTLRTSGGLGIVQFEFGLHRLAERYYLPDEETLVAEILHWKRMFRLGLSFPVSG